MGGEDKLEQLWIAYSLKKFAHGSGGGGLTQRPQGTRPLGCVTAPWASEDSACTVPGICMSTCDPPSPSLCETSQPQPRTQTGRKPHSSPSPSAVFREEEKD